MWRRVTWLLLINQMTQLDWVKGYEIKISIGDLWERRWRIGLPVVHQRVQGYWGLCVGRSETPGVPPHRRNSSRIRDDTVDSNGLHDAFVYQRGENLRFCSISWASLHWSFRSDSSRIDLYYIRLVVDNKLGTPQADRRSVFCFQERIMCWLLPSSWLTVRSVPAKADDMLR